MTMTRQFLIIIFICCSQLIVFSQKVDYEIIDYNKVIPDFRSINYKSSAYWEYVDFYSIAILDSSSIDLMSKLTNDLGYYRIVKSNIKDEDKIQFDTKILSIKDVLCDSLFNKKMWRLYSCKTDTVTTFDKRVLIKNNESCILIVYCDSLMYYYRLTKNINGFLVELAYKE